MEALSPIPSTRAVEKQMFLGHLIPGFPGGWIQGVRKGLAGGFWGQGLTLEIHPPQEVLEGGGRSAPLADPVAPTQVSHHLAASRGLQNFFASTSCSMTLSNVRSATNRFSRWFSSCNCFSWRA